VLDLCRRLASGEITHEEADAELERLAREPQQLMPKFRTGWCG
jgi:hypothetical protein